MADSVESSSSATTLAPIQLRGELHETIWGGRHLATVAGKEIAEGMLVGESWETAIESVASNPPYTGQTLGNLVESMGEQLIGCRAGEIFGQRFPLLTKFIDAQQWLSVQVHPDDRYANEHEGGKLGKTETWYVLHAEPGAKLVFGMAHATSKEDVQAAIIENRLEAMLNSFEVHVGDVIFVPAGTVHAIGAGIILYELQEYSDVTYRLYDYGRLQANGQPRPLHVNQALDVMQYHPSTATRVTPIPVADAGLNGERRLLVACDYFVEEELDFRGEYAAATDSSSCHIITLLAGACEVLTQASTLSLRLGDTAVIPAALGAYRMQSTSGARLVRSYVPVAEDRLLQLWQSQRSS